MGSRSVREPTDDELQKFGKGKVALFLLKPVGSDDRTKQKAVWYMLLDLMAVLRICFLMI